MKTSVDHLLIDSHAHLDARAFDLDRPQVLQRAWDGGLRAIITVGVEESLEGVQRAVSIAEENDAVYATVGFHPHDAEKVSPEMLEGVRELAGNSKVVGVGETGLDYHYMHSPARVQQDLFHRILRLGRQLDLPVVIHTREADEDTVSILREALQESAAPLCGVVHCFSGDYALARQVLDMGLHISFTGVITFPAAAPLRDVLKKVPLERVLLETDCPYLAPVPFRGKRNEPAFVARVAEKMAAVLGKSPREVVRVTGGNTMRLFRLPI
jgi:TatD DNase family protein